VWWDTDISIGSVWRDVLADRIDHARAVCVIWTVNSVSSQFVRDEASRAHERGVLVPVRLDPVDQPLGFGEIQYVDLFRPEARADVMRQIARLERLVDGAAPVDMWQTQSTTRRNRPATALMRHASSLSVSASCRICQVPMCAGRSVPAPAAPAGFGHAASAGAARPLAGLGSGRWRRRVGQRTVGAGSVPRGVGSRGGG
jgi:hypothetical protein